MNKKIKDEGKKVVAANDIVVIEKEINPFLEQAQKMVVKSADDMKVAAEVLSRLNMGRDKAIERMETITGPAKAVVKAAEAVWKPLIVSSKEAIEVIRAKVGDYQMKEVLRARAEEAALAARVGAGKGRLSVEKAVEKIEAINRPEDKVVVSGGSLSFTEKEDFEVIDISLLDAKYLLANEVAIRGALKEGVRLKGVRYFMKMVPRNNR